MGSNVTFDEVLLINLYSASKQENDASIFIDRRKPLIVNVKRQLMGLRYVSKNMSSRGF